MRFYPAELWLTWKTTPRCDGDSQKWQLLQHIVLNAPGLAGCSCTAGLEHVLRCFLGVTTEVTSSACWGQALPRSALQSSLMLKQQGGNFSHHCWALFLTEDCCRWQLPTGCSGFGLASAAALGTSYGCEYRLEAGKVYAGNRRWECQYRKSFRLRHWFQCSSLLFVMKYWKVKRFWAKSTSGSS